MGRLTTRIDIGILNEFEARFKAILFGMNEASVTKLWCVQPTS
ncbi:MAG: hypothetical protein QME16_07905 [Planctomycetota bacterium]|nr:hypothetical protein [Planctomycetota bacterium]